MQKIVRQLAETYDAIFIELQTAFLELAKAPANIGFGMEFTQCLVGSWN